MESQIHHSDQSAAAPEGEASAMPTAPSDVQSSSILVPDSLTPRQHYPLELGHSLPLCESRMIGWPHQQGPDELGRAHSSQECILWRPATLHSVAALTGFA